MIPPLQQIEIPESIPNRLKKDIWRSLKTLKREYTEAHEEEEINSDDYARMGHWDQKKKQDRRRMQNRKAARRFRVKNLEVIWALVTSFQDQKRQNNALRMENQRLRAQQGAAAPPLAPPDVKPQVQASPKVNAPPVPTPKVPGLNFPPPLPPQAGKKRKLNFGEEQLLAATSGTSWIVQKNALDADQQRMLTLTIVCGMQAVTPATDPGLLARLRAQAQLPAFTIADGQLPGTANGKVRLPKAWLTALQTIAGASTAN